MDIANRILELCEEQNISINRLAELSDVTQSTLNSLVNSPDPNPQYKTIERICTGLNTTLAEFFLEEKPELEPELRRLLDTARRLSPEQRQHLQKLLEAMSKG
jgi:transcriptional regulator with XRE-family HTH domain